MLLLLLAPPAGAATKLVAGGLDNPRGLVFGPDGALYVAAAGHGGPRCGKLFCSGRTGSIIRIAADGSRKTIASRLPSFANADGTFAAGATDVAFDADGRLHSLVSSGGRKLPGDTPASIKKLVGRVVRIEGGRAIAGAAVDRIERTKNPDGENIDSNPYTLAFSGGDIFVADAGGNDLLRVRGSTVTVSAVFPHATKEAQSVPTVVRPGPDGMLYVGELSGDAAPNGRSRVYRVDPSADGVKPVVVGTGFSRITGLCFAADGTMFVSEFSRRIQRGDPRGRVIRVGTDGRRTVLGADRLRFPGGCAVSPDGSDLYVANWSGAAAKPARSGATRGRSGQVVRIDL